MSKAAEMQCATILYVFGKWLNLSNHTMNISTCKCHTFRRMLDLSQRAPCLLTARQEHLSGTLFSLPQDSLENKAQILELVCTTMHYAIRADESARICQQTQKHCVAWNAAIIGGLINVWGGTSCNRQRSFTWTTHNIGRRENKPK